MCGVPEGILQRAREVLVAQRDGSVLPARTLTGAYSLDAGSLVLVRQLREIDLEAPDWREKAAGLLHAAASAGHAARE